MVLRLGPPVLILLGASLGLAAMFLDWTGDGRGIDYILPGQRFQQAHQLPLPLTILAIGIFVGVGVTFLSGASNFLGLRRGRSVLRWSGVIAALMMAAFPVLAHFSYEFWRYYNEYGLGVFRSGDWGPGLSIALAGGFLAIAGVVLSKIVERRPQMGQFLLLGSLVLLGTILASCGGAQSFQTAAGTPPGSGAGWRAIGPEGIDVTSLSISPDYSRDDTIFLGLAGWDLGVFRSTDGGDNWQEVYEGLRGPVAPWVVVSPAFTSDGTLFAGRGNGGVYRSTDGGDSWKRVSRGIPRYEDDGERCGYHIVYDLAFSPSFASDTTVYVGSGNGLFRSTDGGDTWRRVDQGLTSDRVTHVVLSPSFASDNTLFVMGSDFGEAPHLFRSTDRGDTWQKVYSYDEVLEGNFVPWVAVSPEFATDSAIFTSKVCGGVFRSTDGGDTWQDVSQQLTVPAIALSPDYHTCDPPGFTSLVFSPSFTADSSLFVRTEVGIFQLTEFSVADQSLPGT